MTTSASTVTPDLLIARDADVMRLTLNRPDKGNALSAALVVALMQAVEAAREERIRLLVISGAGRHFCTGFDLSGLDGETDDSLLARFTRVELLLQAVRAAPFTTLALAHGRTMGAGADLFCACTERWIVGQASFAFPGAAFGLVLGTTRLADTVGARHAREWVESGATIDDSATLAAGFATQRLDTADLESEICRLARRTGRLDAPTQAAVHHAIGSSARFRGNIGDALDLCRLVQSAARPGIKSRIAAYRAAQLKP